MAKKPVSQSRTMWVKAGEVVNGKTVKKGYLAQYGKPEKRVTARVKIETATESGKKAGEVYRYKAGRTVKPSDKVKGPKNPPPGSPIDYESRNKTASRLGKPGEYQAGRGMKSGSASTAGSIKARQAKAGSGKPSMVGARGRLTAGTPASEVSVVGLARRTGRGLSKMEAVRRREYERMWKKIQSGALVVTKAQEAAIRKILYGK
jgi:hypothetical protein